VFCVKAHTEISCRTIISYSDVDLGNDIGTAPSGFCHSGTLLIHNSLYMQSLENSLKCEKKSWALLCWQYDDDASGTDWNKIWEWLPKVWMVDNPNKI